MLLDPKEDLEAETDQDFDVLLWLELPEGLIVGSTLVHPDERGDTFGQSLLAALRSPMIGRPRRPDRVRVADASLAREVRAVLGEAVNVRVAPTPEFDAVIHSLSEHIGDEGDEPASYLEGGRVSPAAVADLFRAARLLFDVAPWKVMPFRPNRLKRPGWCPNTRNATTALGPMSRFPV